jgi:mono/diheme cytochrome c family protein
MYEFILAAKTTIKRATTVAILIASQGALAAEDVWQPHEANTLWQSECGSCHMAFPPALLSKDDWHLLMQGLDKHFGVDASLDTKMRDEISAFLERNAGSRWSHSAESQRITDTSWFIRKHKGAISMMIKGRVKSLVDCVACHKGH